MIAFAAVPAECLERFANTAGPVTSVELLGVEAVTACDWGVSCELQLPRSKFLSSLELLALNALQFRESARRFIGAARHVTEYGSIR